MAKIYHEDQIKALDQRLKSGSVRGAYLFCGEEEYLKRHYLTNVRNLLVPDPDLGVFDAIRIGAYRTGDSDAAHDASAKIGGSASN